MLTPESLIRLPYTDDLTITGITYALRSLAYTYNRMGGTSFERLRRIVAGKAVELAFRRHLDGQQVPYDTLGATPFTDPDHYDVALGGHRCDVKSFLLSRRKTILQVRQSPDVLFNAAALVPSDQLASQHLREQDLYLFAFVMALVAGHSNETQSARQAGQPIYLMHPLPVRWARPPRWRPLGKLSLKLEAEPALMIEVGGQTAGHEFHIERLQLSPGKRVVLDAEFFSLSYVHIEMPSQARLGIRSPELDETYVIEPLTWGNIWLYGMDIFLAGYVPYAEFCQRAAPLPAGSPVWQYPCTRTANHSLLVSDLYPLGGLFAQVKAWERQKTIKTE
jgi:hypothetical protein